MFWQASVQTACHQWLLNLHLNQRNCIFTFFFKVNRVYMTKVLIIHTCLSSTESHFHYFLDQICIFLTVHKLNLMCCLRWLDFLYALLQNPHLYGRSFSTMSRYCCRAAREFWFCRSPAVIRTLCKKKIKKKNHITSIILQSPVSVLWCPHMWLF